METSDDLRLIPNEIGVQAGLKLWVLIGFCLCLYIFSSFVGNLQSYYVAMCALGFLFVGALLPLVQLPQISVSCQAIENPRDPGNIDVAVRVSPPDGGFDTRLLLPLCVLQVRILYRKLSLNPELDRRLATAYEVMDFVYEPEEFRTQIKDLGRGVYSIDAVEVRSSFPFGMFFAKRTFSKQKDLPICEVVIAPKCYSIGGRFLSLLPSSSTEPGYAGARHQAIASSASTSFRGLREFVVGDSLRNIHWASSARHNKLLVREFESESQPVFDLVLDLSAGFSELEFEVAVCVAYSIFRFASDLHLQPRMLVLASGRSDVEPCILSVSSMQRLSSYFSRLERLGPPDEKDRLRNIGRVGGAAKSAGEQRHHLEKVLELLSMAAVKRRAVLTLLPERMLEEDRTQRDEDKNSDSFRLMLCLSDPSELSNAFSRRTKIPVRRVIAAIASLDEVATL